MKPCDGLSLPPRLEGNTRATLEVTMESIESASRRALQNARVRVLWWGQNPDSAVVFSPDVCRSKDEPNLGVRVAIYKVVSRESRFREYLRDAGRLFLETFDGHGKTLGFAVVERLERLVDFGGLADHLDVFDEKGNVVARLKCRMLYEDMEEQKRTSVKRRPVYRPPSKAAPVVLTSKRRPQIQVNAIHDNKPKVTFSDENLVYEDQSNDDDYVDFEAECQDEDLRRILLRSHKRVTQTKLDPVVKPPSEQDLISLETNPSTTAERRLEDQELLSRPSGTASLPLWNLSTERLRFISQVTQIVVKVSKVELKKDILPYIKSLPAGEKKRKNVAAACHRAFPTFFVNYSVPPGNNVSNFCSKKKHHSSKSEQVHFDSKSVHMVKFDTHVLDTWWTNDLQLKFYSRMMNQRVPALIGQANLGLKHLLMNSKYSQGAAEMKLPLYTSTSLHRHARMPNEIIGDIHVAFSFVKADEKKNTIVQINHTVPEKECSKMKGTTTTTLRSKGVSQQSEMKAASTVTSTSGSDGRNSFSSSTDNSVVLCLLRVDEGRNFCSGSSEQNLYLSCRFFSPTDSVTSTICWNTTSPKFEMHHVVPVHLTEDFLEGCCRLNHLVVEVWNYAEPSSKLVGVATVSLHQLYTAFQASDRQRMLLSTDLPVVAVNDWLSVRDMLTGHEMGQVRALLAAGVGSQLHHLVTMMDGNNMQPTLSGRSSVVSTPTYATPAAESTDEDSYVEEEEEHSVEISSVEPVKLELKENRRQPENEAASCSSSSSRLLLPFEVTVQEARNLPLILSKEERKPPNTYVTLPLYRQQEQHVLSSHVIKASSNPQWSHRTRIHLPIQLLSDPKRQFIVKVWHKPLTQEGKEEEDYVVGFAAIDLSILLRPSGAFTSVCGWYNVMDFVGRCRGQVKVNVIPLTDLSPFKKESTSNIYSVDSGVDESSRKSDIYDSVTNTPIKSPSPCQDSIQSDTKKKEIFWKPPAVNLSEEEAASRSFLASKLCDLTELNDRLKAKLESKSPPPPRFLDNVEDISVRKSDKDEDHDVSQLRSNIHSKLRLMQEAIHNVSTRIVVQDQPDACLTHTIDSGDHNDDEDFSNAEEVDLLPLGPEEEEISCASPQPDVETVDWSRVSVTDGRKPRMAPEGGNPAQEQDA